MNTLPDLGYEYNALEPYIDEQTMKIHHTKHHQAYIDKLNAALKDYKDLQNKSAEELIKDLSKIPEAIRTAVRNHGGGHVNHSFWWPLLKKDIKFSGEVAEAIKTQFGSYEKFKEEFSKASMSIFGSGWAWLVVNKDGGLGIVTTPNQNSPISEGKIPILGVDMWEHSMYLKFQNRKQEYLEAFFNVINWEQVEKNYKDVKK